MLEANALWIHASYEAAVDRHDDHRLIRGLGNISAAVLTRLINRLDLNRVTVEFFLENWVHQRLNVVT